MSLGNLKWNLLRKRLSSFILGMYDSSRDSSKFPHRDQDRSIVDILQKDQKIEYFEDLQNALLKCLVHQDHNPSCRTNKKIWPEISTDSFIGKGGSGSVSKFKKNGKLLIVKKIDRTSDDTEGLLIEVAISSIAFLANIGPSIFCLILDQNAAMIVQEYVDVNLFMKRVKDRSLSDKHKKQLRHKVERLHDLGIVHLDLKSDNVGLLNDEVYLIDFGVSNVKQRGFELVFNINVISDSIGVGVMTHNPDSLRGVLEFNDKLTDPKKIYRWVTVFFDDFTKKKGIDYWVTEKGSELYYAIEMLLFRLKFAIPVYMADISKKTGKDQLESIRIYSESMDNFYKYAGDNGLKSWFFNNYRNGVMLRLYEHYMK